MHAESEHWTAEALAKGDLTVHLPNRADDPKERLAQGEELEAALLGPEFVDPAPPMPSVG